MEERDAGAQKYWVNVEPDFVNQAGLEQRMRQLATAHQADIFAALLLQVTHVVSRVSRDYGDRPSASFVQVREKTYVFLSG
jgi:hypothetical protein